MLCIKIAMKTLLTHQMSFYEGEGFLRSNVPFTITQNGDRVSGASGSYDINNKKIKAKNVKGEFNR